LQGKPLFYAKDRLEDALSHILDETSLFRIYGEDGLVALGQWKDGEVRSRSMFMM
jgi:hypothetical protein